MFQVSRTHTHTTVRTHPGRLIHAPSLNSLLLTHTTQITRACAHSQPLHLQGLLWPRGGGGWCGESSPLATCWPLSHADDPGSLRRAWGLAPSETVGWGQGSAAHTHRACAHAPLLPRPRPAQATSTTAACSSGSAGRPTALSRRCLAASMGEGSRTGRSSPLPKLTASRCRVSG